MLIPSIQQKYVEPGTRVLLRTMLNLPMVGDIVISKTRLQNSLETIQFLQDQGARTTLISHMSDSTMSLTPIHKLLNATFPVSFVPCVTGEVAYNARAQLNPGDTILLENTRIDKREVENDSLFVDELVANTDLFVFDDFTVAHRAHASTVGVIEHSLRTPASIFIKNLPHSRVSLIVLQVPLLRC